MDLRESANSASREKTDSIKKPKEAKQQIDITKTLHPVVIQQMKQPRCKSSVWAYFERLDTAVAKCRICNGNYRFGSSISNLRLHAQIKHADILKQGPLKFLQRLKVPEEQLQKLVSTMRKTKLRVTARSKKKNSDLDQCKVKVEPKKFTRLDASSDKADDMDRTMDTIYEKTYESVADYLRSPTNSSPLVKNNELKMQLDPEIHTNLSNENSDKDEECEVDLLRTEDVIINNPLHNANTTTSPDDRMQRLREERFKAETNYFNRKAEYMERSSEYVNVQKRHLLLQTQKLKIEIAAMKAGIRLHSTASYSIG